MGQVIHVNFVSKQVTTGPSEALSYREIELIEVRIETLKEIKANADDVQTILEVDSELEALDLRLQNSQLIIENKHKQNLLEGTRKKGQRLKVVA